MTDASLSRRLSEEQDFELGQLRVSPSTVRVFLGAAEFRVEALTMAVLVTLARAQGATVSRDALVESCWQGRIVSDDAVSRAIAKVRAIERAADPPAFTIETVPKIGYRLLAAGAGQAVRTQPAVRPPSPRWWVAAAASAVLLLIAAPFLWTQAAAGKPADPARSPQFEDSGVLPPLRAADFSDALLVLDEQRLRLYLRRGWNPNWKLDSEGNAALHNLMMVCERNRHHDRDGVTRVARLLVESGADPTARNKWNDTPLIIAQTPRYCGPNHPVVAYLKATIARPG